MPPTHPFSSRRLEPALCGGLVLLTLLAYWGIWSFDFTTFDDPTYVVENTNVHGLTWQHVREAFTTNRGSYWAPLTWISFMVDYEVWGLDPAGFHLHNLALHMIAVVLLFLALARMTGAVWRSAIVVAVFAVHPVHVEAVAWIAERKEMLASVFWTGSLFAYAHYARAPSWRRALPVVVAMALGLMSKPTLVTLPIILLLLDYWPLERLRGRADLTQRLLEKAPLATLSVASSLMTSLAARDAIIRLSALGLGQRLANAVCAYVRYLELFFWPANLAPYYPREWAEPSSVLTTALAALALAGITALALRLRAGSPHLIVGWTWYLASLVPVIGLVQVGDQALADRFLHLPSIGLSIAVVWGLAAVLRRAAVRGAVVAGGIAALLLALVAATRLQASYWRDSASLYERAIAVTGGAFVPEHNLALALANEGRLEEAVLHLRAALRFNPASASAYSDLGLCYLRLRRGDEARAALERALRLDPEHAGAHQNLGTLFASAGRLEEAIELFQRTIELDPRAAHARFNLALALEQSGRSGEAIQVLEDSIRLGIEDDDAAKLLERLRSRSGS